MCCYKVSVVEDLHGVGVPNVGVLFRVPIIFHSSDNVLSLTVDRSDSTLCATSVYVMNHPLSRQDSFPEVERSMTSKVTKFTGHVPGRFVCARPLPDGHTGFSGRPVRSSCAGGPSRVLHDSTGHGTVPSSTADPVGYPPLHRGTRVHSH